MNELKSIMQKKERLSWGALGLGVVIFLAGLAVRRFLPGSPVTPQLVEGIGIGFIVYAVGTLLRLRLAARQQPISLQRELIAEQDERNQSISRRAGANGFKVAMALNFLVLYLYSYFTRGQPGFDLLWFALAGMFIVPGLVFIVSQVVLQGRE